MNPTSPQDADADMAAIFDDAAFNTSSFDTYSAESPFDTSRYLNFSADSPDYQPRTPSKAFLEQDATVAFQTQQLPTRPPLPRSVGSSSQDSTSDSSSRRKRKTTSESPPTENLAGLKMGNPAMVSNESMEMDPASMGRRFSRPHNMRGNTMDMTAAFDFDSAASSPGIEPGIGAFNPQAAMKKTAMRNMNPAGTIEPSQFFVPSSGASPISNAPSAQGNGSPAMFANNVPGQEMFSNGQMWNNGATPAWTDNFGTQYASPGALGLTPSPAQNPGSITSGRSSSVTSEGMIPLHVGAIPAKSRVETQINIRLTIDHLPPGISKIHLPTHTIAKAKLLNNDTPAKEETLEMHAMLVCTSAMNNPEYKQRALNNAARQDNVEIQSRGNKGLMKKEDRDENAEDEKPSNGGEVRICTNCINRERKRAARKKLKKEEEQAHWERYETERVIVFNTNEYKAWLDWQHAPPLKDAVIAPSDVDLYAPTSTAMQITAPMRIACYCRHQNEKDGFQVIFTLKDHAGKVVAQALSDSILITDDHKTHPMTPIGSGIWYDTQNFGAAGFGSQSMVDLQQHMPSMSMSKSTGNLQSLAFGHGANLHQSSSVHHMPGFSLGGSGSATPRNLSRPASPTFGGAAGPSKKRKSSSTHRRIPSGLAMTKVDTSQAMATSNPSALTSTPFSPTSMPNFTPNTDTFSGLSQPSSRTSFHTQPPTPSDNPPFYRSLDRTTSLDQTNFQAFYSAPNSAHQSRAGSPILHQNHNLAAFHRQHPSARNSSNPFSLTTPTTLQSQPSQEEKRPPPPIVNKIVPSEGPATGGIEVSIYGQNFTPGMEVVFGDRTATATTYWGEKSLCCVLPPSTTIGPCHVSIVSSSRGGPQSFTGGGGGQAQAQVFRYNPDREDVRTMEMALRFYALKVTGNEDNWQQSAQEAAGYWMQGKMGEDGGGGRRGSGTMQAVGGPVGGNVPGAFPG